MKLAIHLLLMFITHSLLSQNIREPVGYNDNGYLASADFLFFHEAQNSGCLL